MKNATPDNDRQSRHIHDPRKEFSMMRLMVLLLLLAAVLYFGIKYLF